MSEWQPLESGEWIDPGTANTSRPCSAALRAVISEPDASAASTTRQPCARPLMRRLRRGKLWASALVPSANSETSKPRSAICGGKRRVCLRIGIVDAGAEHRDGRALGREPAAVRRGVDALRQAGDDGQAGGAEAARELLRVACALGGCVAAADHGQRGPVEQFGAAVAVEQGRRVGDLQQQAWVRCVGQRDDRASRAARARRAHARPLGRRRRNRAPARRPAPA